MFYVKLHFIFILNFYFTAIKVPLVFVFSQILQLNIQLLSETHFFCYFNLTRKKIIIKKPLSA